MDTAQEALFRAMLNEAWFTKSNGHVYSPTGYFGYVTNTENELNEIYQAFSEVIDTYGQPKNGQVIGSWFAWINSDGVIRIHQCLNDSDARGRYNIAYQRYARGMNS